MVGRRPRRFGRDPRIAIDGAGARATGSADAGAGLMPKSKRNTLPSERVMRRASIQSRRSPNNSGRWMPGRGRRRKFCQVSAKPCQVLSSPVKKIQSFLWRFLAISRGCRRWHSRIRGLPNFRSARPSGKAPRSGIRSAAQSSHANSFSRRFSSGAADVANAGRYLPIRARIISNEAIAVDRRWATAPGARRRAGSSRAMGTGGGSTRCSL